MLAKDEKTALSVTNWSIKADFQLKFRKTLVTRYNLLDHEVLNQFKSRNGF